MRGLTEAMTGESVSAEALKQGGLVVLWATMKSGACLIATYMPWSAALEKGRYGPALQNISKGRLHARGVSIAIRGCSVSSVRLGAV